MLNQLTRLTLFGALAVFLASAIGQPTAAHAFPSLFRPRLFQGQRNINQQPQQQQQQQQIVQHQPEPILIASNSLQPTAVSFDPFGLRHQLPHLSGRRPQLHQQDHLIGSQEHQFDPQAAYFKPTISGGSSPMMPLGHVIEHHQSTGSHAIGGGVHPMASFHEPATLRLESSSGGNDVGSTVDKIENHIGTQIEQSLKAGEQLHGGAAASEYHQQPHAEHKQHHEKESAAAASGGSEEAEEGGEPVAEKREEKHHEEHKQHHEEHEHPPEAFEVHHKKGGKSFQYFHQGHQHP